MGWTHSRTSSLVGESLDFALISVVANFWWKTREDSNDIHWVAWDKLCTQISDGGLGFRTLEEFNL